MTGMLVYLLLVQHNELDMAEKLSQKTEIAAHRIHSVLVHDEKQFSKKEFLELLEQVRSQLDFSAIKIKPLDINALEFGNDSIFPLSTGSATPDLVSQRHILDVHSKNGDHQSVELILYYPDPKKLMAQKRKNLFLGIGTFLLAFGIILAMILQQIIAKPFSAMVYSAKAFSDGDHDSRFNTNQSAEFGYLASFFNRILDKLLSQRDELQSALNRVKASEAELFQEKERVEVTLHSIGDAVITTDRNGSINYMNPVAEALLNISDTEAKGKPISDILSLLEENEARSPISNPISACLNTNEVVEKTENIVAVTPDGNRIAVSLTVSPIRSASGNVIGTVMVLHNMEQNRALSRQLSYQASHDELTGLYNRRAFEQFLQSAIDSAISEGHQHALCYLDLDQFKIVNDTCGHIAGDELLKQLAGLLKEQFRDSDILARLGGDEFGLILHHCDPEKALRKTEKIHELIASFRFYWDSHVFEAGASSGLVSITSDTRTLDQILGSADIACYAAKEKGRNRIHVYQPDDDELKQRRGEMRWVSRIKEALEQDRLQLYYQPIAEVNDIHSRYIHFEVLVRMLDKDNKLIPPMNFIPAAERFNLMPAIDRWVISHVFSFLKRNIHSKCSYLCCINLSGQSLGDDNFQQFIVDGIRQNHISPENICFEITETAAITNLARARVFMKTLRAMGCKFSLDDFGSGLSSFSYLKELSVDFLKIDGVFIRDMAQNPIDYAMVEAVNRIGHVMRLQTIAEFVENDEILKQLHLLGINYAQGYGIARPAPIEQLLDMIKAKGIPLTVPSRKTDN